jgi:UDP-4-amino-4-deoxy-L-arabinose-oxoglutarate aminotransferase
MDPIRKLALDHGVPVVEDAAHALGTRYRSVPVGHTGISIFSLQAIKNVTTAEGGVICTDDAELAERLRRLRFHGLGADAWTRESQGRSPTAEVLEPGYKYNLPDMNAALGLGQMRRLKAIIARRAEIAQLYRQAFAEMAAIEPLAVPDCPHKHAWHLFAIRVITEQLSIDRASFMSLLKERQIGTGIHFRDVHRQKFYAGRYADAVGKLENTEWNSDRLVTLPLFADMSNADAQRVISNIREIVEQHSS